MIHLLFLYTVTPQAENIKFFLKDFAFFPCSYLKKRAGKIMLKP